MINRYRFYLQSRGTNAQIIQYRYIFIPSLSSKDKPKCEAGQAKFPAEKQGKPFKENYALEIHGQLCRVKP